ncbi:Vacuolar protein sorting-associated protein 45 [Tritrichomonas foetus]|uniref:Vacuolar protein sorting-associated protein 45 n=1 Tax=Tritrichomonas foetus TaxID=1144522 RepID=A0A1J4KTH8_9EUKA|nr:Vacuolar protein sorting-associated protein 45 [Tritrichomonas foetus]|eukprot:OHT14200.1 Vacuolar protein sorting-associated protein 45 [Tritrichomonas foetus]
MDTINALRSYIESVLTNVHDMKVLLFDDETSHIASLVYTQSELLKHDVVLIEPLSKCVNKVSDDALSILQCVCILRPTQQNIHDLCSELNSPHFNTYYIFFTNVVQKEMLRQLALADHCCKVFVVHEIFIDVLALNKRLFSVGVPSCINSLMVRQDDPKMQRIVDGLFSMICAFKLKTAIKYDASSSLCKAVGERLSRQIDDNNDLFQSTTATSLIILIDRRTDPLTPILHNWSYQSLLHEIVGINNNIVKVSNKQSIVLDERTDDFFCSNLNANYGDLGEAHNNLLKSVQAQHTDVKDIQDVEALKKFIHTYPIYQEKKAVAAKHSELLSAISSSIKNENLLEFAPLEQEIAVENSQAKHFEGVMASIRDSRITDQNALRIAILYALRYEGVKDNNIDDIKGALYSRHKGDRMVDELDRAILFAGNSYKRAEPLFLNKSLFSKARNFIGLDESGQNKFMQYTPHFASLVQKLEKKQFESPQFPSIRELPGTLEPKKFIIFYVGGATYEEGRIAYQAASSGLDIIVGGTTIHNMKSFVSNEIMGNE